MRSSFFNMPRWQWSVLVGRSRTFATCAALGVLVTACHGPFESGSNCPNGVCPYTDIGPPPNGAAQFTVVPTAPVPGLSLTALGSLNPPGHTLPTDHVYFYS